MPAGDALTGERALEGGLDQAVEVLEPVADRAAILAHRSLLVGRQTLDAAGHPRNMLSGPHRAARPNHSGSAGSGGATAGRGRGIGFCGWAAAGWR
jgi:hypothetical protein